MIVVFFLGGLVTSYKGFKRTDRKGTVLIVHGFLSFVAALVAATWLIGGEWICFSGDEAGPVRKPNYVVEYLGI
jgi:hypothetical protein